MSLGGSLILLSINVDDIILLELMTVAAAVHPENYTVPVGSYICDIHTFLTCINEVLYKIDNERIMPNHFSCLLNSYFSSYICN